MINSSSKKLTTIFTLVAVLSSSQIVTMAPVGANPYMDSVRDIERDAKILEERGRRGNQQIISGLSCQELINRANTKKRNYYRWIQIAQNSTTEYNRRSSLASAQGSLNAISQYRNQYKRKGC
jgi:hypothetical protein